MKSEFEYCIDGVKLKLAEEFDTTLIESLGTIICTYNQNDSGNISFDVEINQGRILVKRKQSVI